MPAKDRRVAARQAKLRQRRRRQGPGPSGIPSAGPVSLDGERQVSHGVAADAPGPSGAAPSPSREGSPTRGRSDASWRSAARTRVEQSSTDSYVGPELRRILTVSSAIIIILAILAFFLSR